jgi:hypothetical protein
MRTSTILLAVSSVSFLGLTALAGCASTHFQGQVVSCADQKPLPAAKLSYKSTNTVDGAMLGNWPGQTDESGKFKADVELAQGAGVMVTAEKDGYETKQQTMTGGAAEQQICLAPKK